MKWLAKKKANADVILPAVEKTGLFSRKIKDRLSTENAETVEVVSVVDETAPASAPGSDIGDTLSRVEPVLDSAAAALLDVHPIAAEPAATQGEQAAEANVHPARDEKPKKSLWKKGPQKEKEPKPVRAAKATPEKAAAAAGPRPLKVLIGYLPDSSERDTYYYMLGVAEKNLDSENIGFAGLTKFETGYAYEIHEGGSGRGYLDSILSYFRSLPAFSAEETHRAFIRTATRTVRVERTPAGIYSVILPESDTTPQSEWVVPGKKLSALVEKRTGLFVAGVVIFLSSIVALMGGYATRYQPYTASVVNIERVPVAKLPFSQWPKLTHLPPGDYVKALKYEKGEWLIQTPSNPSGKAGGIGKVAAPKGGMNRTARPDATTKADPVTASVTSVAEAAPARAEAPARPSKSPRLH